ncbi:MAG: hypothetical protein FWH38_06250, partial [Treponema sp.]|nr:hypothetical protein [Treponema sp.]
LLLDIARKEKDVPAIKELAFGFIEYGFRKDYFEIYKAAFSQEEWTAEREKLITHYSREKYFNESAADLLAVESDTGRLISYIEKHPSLSALEKYMAVLAYDYPEKTLNLLGKAISSYAKDHAGRAHYTYILSLLKKMARITGGRAAVSDLVADFRTRYKGRRAMMEILGKFR